MKAWHQQNKLNKYTEHLNLQLEIANIINSTYGADASVVVQ